MNVPSPMRKRRTELDADGKAAKVISS